MDEPAVVDGDATSLLPAMLNGIQSQIYQPGRVQAIIVIDAEQATGLTQLVLRRNTHAFISRNRACSLRSFSSTARAMSALYARIRSRSAGCAPPMI